MIRMIETEDNKSDIYSMTGLKNKADVYNWYTMHYGQNKRHFEKWFDVARKSGAIKQFNTRLMPYKYYLYPDEILGVLEYDGTPFGSKDASYGESIKRSNRRRSNRLKEAASTFGGFTVQDLADVAIGNTKVEIYNQKSENYIAYDEYIGDVVRDKPEIAVCEVVYLSARGNNRLHLEVYSDYTEESKNWR